MIAGAPLAWPKTRGGQHVVDAKDSLVRISGKKVEWKSSWIGRVLMRKSVFSRACGFSCWSSQTCPAVPSPVYRWTSKIGPGSFTDLPLALQLTLRFFLEAVCSAPARTPKAVPRPGEKSFELMPRRIQVLCPSVGILFRLFAKKC